MINKDTPYKLAEIIRDTWPQLYDLNKDDIENQQRLKSASAPVIPTVLNKSTLIENQQ